MLRLPPVTALLGLALVAGVRSGSLPSPSSPARRTSPSRTRNLRPRSQVNLRHRWPVIRLLHRDHRGRVEGVRNHLRVRQVRAQGHAKLRSHCDPSCLSFVGAHRVSLRIRCRSFVKGTQKPVRPPGIISRGTVIYSIEGVEKWTRSYTPEGPPDSLFAPPRNPQETS